MSHATRPFFRPAELRWRAVREQSSMMTRSSQLTSHPIPPPARSFALPGGPVGILLIHGFAGSIADLRPLADHFSKSGASVVGVRLPGHGQTVDRLHLSRADDWEAAVRHALSIFPATVKRIVIIGESMGGLLGILTYTADPRVAGIVLLAPPFRVAHERKRLAASRLLPSGTRRRKPWVGEAEQAAHVAKGSLLELTVRSYREFLEVIHRARQSVAALKIPVLAVFSKSDQQTALASRQMLQSQATVPVQMIELEGADHHLAIGPHASQLIAAIDVFIAQLP